MSDNSNSDEPNYNQILRDNLERVFNERNAVKRDTALAELFVANPVMYEPTGIVQGRGAISDVAGKLLEQFGPAFRFTPTLDAVGHHGMGTLHWQAGPEGGPIMVTGTDAAEMFSENLPPAFSVRDNRRRLRGRCSGSGPTTLLIGKARSGPNRALNECAISAHHIGPRPKKLAAAHKDAIVDVLLMRLR